VGHSEFGATYHPHGVLVVCVTQIEHYVGQSRVGVYACAEPLGSAPPCETGSGGPWRVRAGVDAYPTPSQCNVYQLGSRALEASIRFTIVNGYPETSFEDGGSDRFGRRKAFLCCVFKQPVEYMGDAQGTCGTHISGMCDRTRVAPESIAGLSNKMVEKTSSTGYAESIGN
jgi:hypothetical protein